MALAARRRLPASKKRVAQIGVPEKGEVRGLDKAGSEATPALEILPHGSRISSAVRQILIAVAGIANLPCATMVPAT